MEAHKTAMIELMLDTEVLTFGDFTGKSGRRMPYFVNAGRFRTGGQMSRLARHYASAIRRSGIEFDVLFGPAYKGIPLVVATAMALHDDAGLDAAFCYNRKEAKDHGEGGTLVGHTLRDGDRVLILEDVTTAGTSIRETVPLLRAAADVTLAGLVVAVDRQERGQGQQNTLAELSERYAMPCTSIVTLEEVLATVRHRKRASGEPLITPELEARIADYRARYGASVETR